MHFSQCLPTVLKPQLKHVPSFLHKLLFPLHWHGSHTRPWEFGGHTQSPVTGSQTLFIPLQPQAAIQKSKQYHQKCSIRNFTVNSLTTTVPSYTNKLVSILWKYCFIGVSFHKHSLFTGQQGKGDRYFNSSLPLPLTSHTLGH